MEVDRQPPQGPVLGEDPVLRVEDPAPARLNQAEADAVLQGHLPVGLALKDLEVEEAEGDEEEQDEEGERHPPHAFRPGLEHAPSAHFNPMRRAGSFWFRVSGFELCGDAQFFSLEELLPEDRFGQETSCEVSPEQLYERAWAATVLEEVTSQLRREYQGRGNSEKFDLLEGYGFGDGGMPTYSEAGLELGMAEGAVKTEVYRLRKRFRLLLRAQVAHTVASPEEISAWPASLRLNTSDSNGASG